MYTSTTVALRLSLALLVALVSGLGSQQSPYYVTLSTNRVSNNGQVVVSFGTLTTAEATSAWLGVFYPANANVSTISPLKDPYSYAPWTSTPPFKWSMLTTVEGTFTFDIETTFYEDAKIALFTNGIDAPVLLAESEAITFADLQMPLQGHLARTDDPSEMVVVYNTKDEQRVGSVVYGTTSGGPYPFSSTKTITNTYTRQDLCGPPANGHGFFQPFFWTYALMSNLAPSSEYYYRYGSDETGWSPEASFVSPPLSAAPVRIALVGDIGSKESDGSIVHMDFPDALETATLLAKEVLSKEYSLLLHVGDLAYACGYLAKWVSYTNMLTKLGLGTRVPIAITQGNHERDYPSSGGGSDAYNTSYDSGGECGRTTSLRFPPPIPFSSLEANIDTFDATGWYGFAHGPVFIIQLNSEASVDVNSAQYEFFVKSLASIDREITPWIIVTCHRPMYYVFSKGGKIDTHFSTPLEPLLLQYKVNLFVEAHVHNTFVSCQVYNGTCADKNGNGFFAPVHIGIGNGGAQLDEVGNSTSTPKWVEYQASEHGFMTLSASRNELTLFVYGDTQVEGHDSTLRFQKTLTL